MYQVKFCGGYEIQVIGKGDDGLCRVADSTSKIVCEGTYAKCEKYLADRQVHQHGHGITAADISATGRGNK